MTEKAILYKWMYDFRQGKTIKNYHVSRVFYAPVSLGHRSLHPTIFQNTQIINKQLDLDFSSKLIHFNKDGYNSLANVWQSSEIISIMLLLTWHINKQMPKINLRELIFKGLNCKFSILNVNSKSIRTWSYKSKRGLHVLGLPVKRKK